MARSPFCASPQKEQRASCASMCMRVFKARTRRRLGVSRFPLKPWSKKPKFYSLARTRYLLFCSASVWVPGRRRGPYLLMSGTRRRLGVSRFPLKPWSKKPKFYSLARTRYLLFCSASVWVPGRRRGPYFRGRPFYFLGGGGGDLV